jgi:hypothetical protein
MQIELPDSFLEQLQELADMYGIQGDLSVVASAILIRAIEEQYELPPEDKHQLLDGANNLRVKITEAVAAVTDFNPAQTLTFNAPPPTKSDVIELSFDEIRTITGGGDLLVTNAQQSQDEVERVALTMLYNQIPKDLWGTIKAGELLTRQIKFIKGMAA